MGIEEGTFWDEHWVLYGNQFVNKFHIKKKGSKSQNEMLVSSNFLLESLHFSPPSPCIYHQQ